MATESTVTEMAELLHQQFCYIPTYDVEQRKAFFEKVLLLDAEALFDQEDEWLARQVD